MTNRLGDDPSREIPSLEAFALWSATYDDDPNPVVALENRILGPLLEPLAGKRLLDAGCGTGRWLEHAAARGAVAAGVDRSLEMLVRARGKAGAGGRVACGDLLRLPFRAAWADVVVCALSLAYADPLEAAVASLAGAARPDGEVWTTDLHPDAVARGWSRSFRSGDARWTAASLPYTLERLETAARAAGLQLRERREPAFGEPERAIFRRAGKESAFEATAAQPALLVCRWGRR